ncbi:hypothetical protein WDU94_007828 [Cyamophila willieti]
MMGSHVAILSGLSGEVLHTLTSPVSGEMMLTAPHLLVKPDGETVVIFCTVHNNAPTSIYVIALSALINGESNRVKTIFSDIQGLTASPILIDMNDDQTEDIVVSSKSKLLIFNGLNYSLILNVSYPFDDSYEHDIQFYPVPGYFNNDSIPTHFVLSSSYSYPVPGYFNNDILDGKTGKSLLPAPIVRSNIADTAGITLSSPGYGNDAFIYWMSSCVNFETNEDDYKLSGRSFEVDICNARFNTSTEIKLMLLSQYVPSPGIVLYSSSKYPGSEPLNVEPEFPSPDEDTRDRDERDEPTKPVESDNNEPTLSVNIQPATLEDKDTSSTENDNSGNNMDDLSNSPERTRNAVKEVEDKSKLSKEVMPRKKRNSNKIIPRYKRKIVDIDTVIDNEDGSSYYQDDFIESEGNGNDIESRVNRLGNSMKEPENNWETVQDKPERNTFRFNDDDRFNEDTTKLNSKQNNKQEYKKKRKELATKIGTIDTDYENHGAEEFDDYGDEIEDRNNVETKENSNDDIANQGGETMNEYGDYKEEEVRGENKIRHEQKYRNRDREMREKEPGKNKKADDDIKTNANSAETQTKNERDVEKKDDITNDERYSKIQETTRKEEINLESVNRMKRHKERGGEYDDTEQGDADDDDDEESEDDNNEEDQDDDDDVEVEDKEDEIQNRGQENDDEKGNYDSDEEEEEEEDEDEEEDDDSDKEENEKDYADNAREGIEKEHMQRDELPAMNNNHNDKGVNSEKVLNRNKRNIESSRLIENYPSQSRYKYYHGPNHKKKISMQEKWWKYIMMTNSEDWQMKKKSLQREENKLKEEKRKFEERQGNMDHTTYMQNKTKELERRSQQLKEEEERLMKHIPSKKMINLDEQFLNYVKKSLALKNNDSSISNYDVDDVEQLWDDFIEINVLNHRAFDDDYEFDNLVKDKDDSKKNRYDIHNTFDESKNNIYHYDNPKQMVSYNLHADHEVSSNGAQKAKLTAANHTTYNLENNNLNHIVDEMDLQQKFKHFNTLDQLKLINRINKNNKTKQNLMVKNDVEHSGSGAHKGTKSSNAKKLPENITSNYKNLKVILKNGENFKYNDYYKWKDNSEYVNFDSYYNILKVNGDGDFNERDTNELNGNKRKEIVNTTSKHKIESPSKLFSLQKNQTLNCNSYFFKRRLQCENKLKSKPQTSSGKNKYSTKKQKSSKKLPKKLHEKIQGHLGIKHIVFNDTKTDSKGRAIVIEKINYKFPFNFGKEKIYSEKDLELIFNNETHAEIKKIMKMNMKKINGSISKLKGGGHNKSEHHHWSHDVNYYKSHKLIRNDEINGRHLNHTNESEKTNKTTREMWFHTLHSLKNNKQFLKHIKSTFYKSNDASSKHINENDNPFDSEGDSNSINPTPGKNTDLITKKIDLQNNMEKIQISELKNSKNKTHKLFPYRRRDKVDQQDKINNANRVENLFGLTDNMISHANQTSLRANKTENHVLGLPVGGKYASRANWHEKSQYGLPLRKWETATEILANSERKHRLMKVKKRSIQDEEEGKETMKLDKRATVKKDLSEISIVPLKSNQSDTSVNNTIQNIKSQSIFESVNESRNVNMGKNPYEEIEFVSNISKSNYSQTNSTINSSKTFYFTDAQTSGDSSSTHDSTKSDPKPDNIVKRSIDKYLKILPRASSTPILTNSLVANDTSSIDILFVSFWVPPKTDIKKLSKSQLECVRQKVLRAKSLDCYNEFDDLLIEEEMAKQCLNLDDARGDGQFNLYYYQEDSRFQFFNPFNLRFGQLSVYRIRIKCKQCQGNVFEKLQNQGWPSGNGQMSNGVFVKKRPNGK